MCWSDVFVLIADQHHLSQRQGVLGDLLKSAQDPTFSTPQEMKKYVIAQELKHRDTIDRACQQFARTRKWPNLRHEEILWLFPRMKEALNLLEFCRIGGHHEHRHVRERVPRPESGILPEMTDQDGLEYLLVDYWHYIGRVRHLGTQTLHL